ncbi:MAG: PilZ domain-containing protein [Fimbriimonadales bacterium]|nr:PilZ domain-containing protein [Fimbriimonadales bacterium]
MNANVQIQIPNTERVLEGVLASLDRQSMRLSVRIEAGVELLRPNMLAQAILMVGGAPRKLTVLVNPADETTVNLTPISSAQCCERRVRKRYPVNIPLEISIGETKLSVRVVNISIGGVGLHAPQALEVGRIFAFTLPLLAGEQALQAHAEVRHRREITNEMWYIGAAFVGLNRADEMWLRKLFP